MMLKLRPAEPRDREAFAGILHRAADIEAHDIIALDDLVDHAFGSDAFVKVVMADDAGQVIGAMAYYYGFNDTGLSVNVIFLYIVEERRLGSAFMTMINFVRRLAGKRGAVSVNFASAIFDERTCGMLQSLKRSAPSERGDEL